MTAGEVPAAAALGDDLGLLIKHKSLVKDQITAEDLGGPPFGRQWYGYEGPRPAGCGVGLPGPELRFCRLRLTG